jgi:hypothetical protein
VKLVFSLQPEGRLVEGQTQVCPYIGPPWLFGSPGTGPKLLGSVCGTSDGGIRLFNVVERKVTNKGRRALIASRMIVPTMPWSLDLPFSDSFSWCLSSWRGSRNASSIDASLRSACCSLDGTRVQAEANPATAADASISHGCWRVQRRTSTVSPSRPLMSDNVALIASLAAVACFSRYSDSLRPAIDLSTGLFGWGGCCPLVDVVAVAPPLLVLSGFIFFHRLLAR